MKILITHNYYLPLDAKQWATRKPYPPLATLFAASALREAGYHTIFHDVQFESSPKHFETVLRDTKPNIVILYEDGFNYLTKMCLTAMRDAAFAMINQAKTLGCKVVISGSDSTDHYELYLNHGADFVLFGEADETLIQLLGQMDSPEKVAGIAYTRAGKTQTTQRKPVLTRLDELPYPAWDLLDIVPYQNAWKMHGYFSINTATTRGCPFKCNWCAKPIYGNRYNSHSPQYIVNLITQMRALFSFDHIWFCDDIFGLKPGWVQEFSKLMKENGLKIPFKIQSRADLLVKENTVQALAEAGCDEVWIGAESGSQKILDAMDKGTTIAQIEESTRLMKSHGIKPCFFLQFGYPSEEWFDIQKTIAMVEKLKPFDIGISVSYPLPGTVFYENVKNQLGEKANWTHSDELLMMYRGHFSAGFYKKLHRYIHRKFRAASAVERFKKSLKPIELMTWAYHKPMQWVAAAQMKKRMKTE